MQPTPFTCSRCNAPLPTGVTQCPNCGLAFASPVPPPAGPGALPPGYGAPQTKKSMSPLAIAAIVGAVGCLPLIMIVAAILFPLFAKTREQARIASSESNLKQIGLGVMLYAQDHNNNLPPTDSAEGFKEAIGKYVTDPDGKLFIQPGAGVPYAYNAKLSKQNMENYSNPAGIVLAREAVPHPGGERAALYLDGHVKVIQDDSGGQEN